MEGILQSHSYARSPLRSFGDPEVEERLGHDDLSPKSKLAFLSFSLAFDNFRT